MRQMNLAALILATAGVSAATAQQRPTDPAVIVPRFDISVGYDHINANAPPGSCNCFGLNGGYGSGSFHVTPWLSAAAEISGTHANNISLLGQNLTLLTFMAGPRVSFNGHRLVPFGQALFGGTHGSDSYFPTATSFTTSASSFALSGGGGLDVNLTHRFAVRAVEAQYLRTTFPNGTNNVQNHLIIGAGLVIKFGGGESLPPPPTPVISKRPSEISFTCSTNLPTVDQGQPIGVVGSAMTEPDRLEVTYSWTTTAGTIVGSGREVTLNTAGIPAGDYRVTGHASLVGSPSTTAECQVAFRVSQKAENTQVVATAAPIPAESAKNDAVFHENVQDALFDYDSSKIRPDAQLAIAHAAQYLKAHPEIRVLVGGYSDERGSAEYNVALSEKRADAARSALIAAGIGPERLQIISYGKKVQVCTAENESCFQQNRRAAFSLHP